MSDTPTPQQLAEEIESTYNALTSLVNSLDELEEINGGPTPETHALREQAALAEASYTAGDTAAAHKAATEIIIAFTDWMSREIPAMLKLAQEFLKRNEEGESAQD